jgi:hypothetical protein
MLYGLTQIEEGPIKGIDSSAWLVLMETHCIMCKFHMCQFPQELKWT